jgi:hypothetical protein
MIRAGRLRVLVASTCFLAALASRAAADDPDPRAVDAHRAGRWSMQFEIEDNFRLGSFSGSGLSVTKNTSESGAWQLGISYGVRTGEVERSLVQVSDTTLTFPGPDEDFDVVSVAVEALRIHRFRPDARVGLDLGLGPVVSFNHQSNEREQPQQPSGVSWQRNSATGGFYGVAARLGAEFMLARSLSVHAHYRGQFGYSRTTNKVENRLERPGVPTQSSEATDRQHSWALDDLQVRMGISVYL